MMERERVKIVAAIFMLIDHIGLIFFPSQLGWRLLGRIAMPLFAYGVAVGFKYTSSYENYMKRMLLLAVVSQAPFLWMFRVAFGKGFALNIGFTFMVALSCLWFLENTKTLSLFNRINNAIIVSLLLVLAQLLHCDYGIYGIGMVYIFYEYSVKRQEPLRAYVLFSLLTMGYCILTGNFLQIYALLALLLIEPLKDIRFKGFKYFFYVFYPLHLLILLIIHQLIS